MHSRSRACDTDSFIKLNATGRSADSCRALDVYQATNLMIRIGPWTHPEQQGRAVLNTARAASQSLPNKQLLLMCSSSIPLFHPTEQSCLVRNRLTPQWRPHPLLSSYCNMSHLSNPVPEKRKKEQRGEENWLWALVSRNTNPYLWQYFSTIMGPKWQNLVLGLLFNSWAKRTAKQVCAYLFWCANIETWFCKLQRTQTHSTILAMRA